MKNKAVKIAAKTRTIVKPHYIGTKSMGQVFEDVLSSRLPVQKLPEIVQNTVNSQETN